MQKQNVSKVKKSASQSEAKAKTKSKSSKPKFVHQRELRYFSEDFRKMRVKELEKGTATVSEISKIYNVSRSAIYKWIEKYSIGYHKAVVKIVEPKSITKKMKNKDETIKNLKQIIAEQQVSIIYHEKLLDILNEHYGENFKKNIGLNHLHSLKKIQKSLKEKD